MKQLTIKEIAPYLPYGLKAVKGVTRIEITSVCLELPLVYHTSYLGSRLRVSSEIGKVKPILRPLSDYKKFDDILDEMSIVDHGHVEEGFVKQLPYSVMEKMFEHHIDVFYLINKNLAIDINALKE